METPDNESNRSPHLYLLIFLMADFCWLIFGFCVACLRQLLMEKWVFRLKIYDLTLPNGRASKSLERSTSERSDAHWTVVRQSVLLVIGSPTTGRKKCQYWHFYFTALLHVGISTLCIFDVREQQKHSNHGGRRPPAAAMVPHPRLWGVETFANVLCNKAT